MFLSWLCLAPHESVAYAYISFIKEVVEWGDGVFVWEREWRVVVVVVVGALWSTQPHYSVDRTAHLLHCSSNQPKLTGILWSPQNRTELQMRYPEWSAKSAFITLFLNTLYSQIWWNGFFSEHYLSLAFQMTQTQRGDVLLRCFQLCDLPPRRMYSLKTRDSERNVWE